MTGLFKKIIAEGLVLSGLVGIVSTSSQDLFKKSEGTSINRINEITYLSFPYLLVLGTALGLSCFIETVCMDKKDY